MIIMIIEKILHKGCVDGDGKNDWPTSGCEQHVFWNLDRDDLDRTLSSDQCYCLIVEVESAAFVGVVGAHCWPVLLDFLSLCSFSRSLSFARPLLSLSLSLFNRSNERTNDCCWRRLCMCA